MYNCILPPHRELIPQRPVVPPSNYQYYMEDVL